MNSGGHRGFTVVTIITLVFAPFFNHHQWLWRLVGETKTTNVVQCAPAQPCPQHKVIVQTVQQPIPPGGGDTGNGNGNGRDNQGHGTNDKKDKH